MYYLEEGSLPLGGGQREADAGEGGHKRRGQKRGLHTNLMLKVFQVN